MSASPLWRVEISSSVHLAATRLPSGRWFLEDLGEPVDVGKHRARIVGLVSRGSTVVRRATRIKCARDASERAAHIDAEGSSRYGALFRLKRTVKKGCAKAMARRSIGGCSTSVAIPARPKRSAVFYTSFSMGLEARTLALLGLGGVSASADRSVTLALQVTSSGVIKDLLISAPPSSKYQL